MTDTNTHTHTFGGEIDARGITLSLEDGDLISDIVVLTEVLKADGSREIVLSEPDFANWLKTEGIISKAWKTF
jgi:hypothetical protein